MQETPNAPSPEHNHQHPHADHTHHSHTAPPMPAAHHAAEQHATHGDYPSDAIQTAKNAFKTFWQNGKSAVGGVVAIQLLLVVITGILALVAILAGVIVALTFVANSEFVSAMTQSLLTQLPPQSAQAIESLFSQAQSNSAIVGFVCLIALVLAAGLGAFVQAIVMSFVGQTVTENQKAHFGQVMSRAFKRTGPLLAQGLLLILAVIAAILVPTLLLTTLGPSAAVLSVMMIIALTVLVIYFAIRLAFAPLAVVALNMGPVQSLKYSWEQSKHRSWEILGAISVIGVLTAIINIVFLYIHSGLKTAAGVDIIVGLIELAIVLFTNLITFAVLAERLNQFRSAGPNWATHKIHYLTNVGAFVVALIASVITSNIDSSLNPKPNIFNNPNYYTPDSSQYQDTDLNNDDLQKELDKYYQESQDLNNSQLEDQYYDYDPEPTDDSYYRLN